MREESAVLAVAAALDRESIAYLVAGSFSSNRWGIPRAT
jgi:hypothetical protein